MGKTSRRDSLFLLVEKRYTIATKDCLGAEKMGATVCLRDGGEQHG